MVDFSDKQLEAEDMLPENWRTSMNHSDELYHYGVKGMKWGVRKQRPSSGARRPSRTSEPRTRKVQKTRSPSYKKPAKTDLLSNDELRRSNERLRLEKEYNTLISEVKRQNRSKGQKFLQDTVMKVGQDILKDVVKSQIKDAIKKQKSSDGGKKSSGGGKKSISHEEPTNKSKKESRAEQSIKFLQHIDLSDLQTNGYLQHIDLTDLQTNGEAQSFLRRVTKLRHSYEDHHLSRKRG